jgi:predicted phosphohydrolase
MLLEAAMPMQTSSVVQAVKRSMSACILVLVCLRADAQNPPAIPAPPAGSLPQASIGTLRDTLLAKAAGLYYSTARAGLQGFDCQVHPDWNLIMISSSKGAPAASVDAKLALLGTVKVILHARLNGNSSLDWQVQGQPEKPIDKAATAMLDQAHRGIENTLVNVLKLWIPIVDGSIAESLGEEDMELAQTENGYVLRSKDKSLTEEFDRNLLLVRYLAVDSGSTVNIEPTFQHSNKGLLLSSFVAHIHPAGAPAERIQEMNVGLEYQAVSGAEVPARLTVEVPNVVQMDFKLDGCSTNSKIEEPK